MNKPINIFVTDITWPDLEIEKSILKELDFEISLGSAKTPEEICDQGKDADVVLQLFTPMTRENLSRLKNCKMLVRMGIGTNSVDLAAATELGIMVANVPDYCQEEVADHTMALFLDIARKTPRLVQQVKEGGWDMRIADPIPRLRGKNFALLGCGGIGRITGTRAASFGLNIIGYDPYLSDSVFAESGICRYAKLEELLKDADFLSLHVPLIPETTGLMNAERLSMMKPTAYIINTARGPIIDEDALYDAVSKKIIAGAALDVLCSEPPKGTHKLATLENVIITPHAGWNSEEAIPELRVKTSQEVVRFVKEGSVKNLVNKDVLLKRKQ